ncbi:isoaspartyl peptidase/L-asparaginase 1 [Physcomitrium patens]|uniref:beta-aspartyl-peptidase n=1 Tax=Physcomitrium patens TaxID=3218 RepID=A0A2K1JHV4_PHYPA|nr:isoaspartyl peptidase/L-asparaginase 1-like isoform X1 [Physcomitrium patens]PNR41134.1 hypothetical protein PHYPA_018537 [Physcomitrium patens]|eukprot:XP_024394296.1 isoaspartyl peptidase/L-asparaginase 1-like isoform X1 [Physcomitrella patens]
MGWGIALHGGAGDISKDLPRARKEAVEACLAQCLRLGVSALESSHAALDVAELVVKELEANPVFNAGRGSVLTTDGTVEMEACIMDGPTMNCGAVSGLSTVVHPISLARLVMERTPHIYLAFEGAEAFARQQGLETKEPSYFITKENQERLARAQEKSLVQLDHTVYSTTIIVAHNQDNPGQKKNVKQDILPPTDPQKPEFETVGCVVVDSKGNCVAATSTGGLVNKMVGRIGDTPVVGAGNYANHLCAVSATGRGEAIIRATVAREVAAIMEYKKVPLDVAVEEVIGQRLPAGKGGLVAVSATGDVVMAFNTTGMYRASMKQGGTQEIGIWH